MPALWITLGLLLFVLFIFRASRSLRYLIWIARDRPAALRAGCRVCGAEAVRATWHLKVDRRRWPFGPTVTLAWCQHHYDVMREARDQTGPAT